MFQNSAQSLQGFQLVFDVDVFKEEHRQGIKQSGAQELIAEFLLSLKINLIQNPKGQIQISHKVELALVLCH